MKALCGIFAVWILLYVKDVTGMGCEEEDSKFKGESEVQYCVNNKWTTRCTVDWEDGNTSADQVCSLIQSGAVETVTSIVTATLTTVQRETTTVSQTVTSQTTVNATITATQTESIERTVMETDYITKTVMVTPSSCTTAPSSTTASASEPSPSTPRSPNVFGESSLGSEANKTSNLATYALGATTGILLILLLIVIIGWICTCRHSSKRSQKHAKTAISASNNATEHEFDNYVYSMDTMETAKKKENQEAPSYYSLVDPVGTPATQDDSIIYETVSIEEVYDYGDINGEAANKYEVPVPSIAGTMNRQDEEQYSQLKH